MFKIITDIFRTDKPEETKATVTIEVEKPKSLEELFNTAVKEQVKRQVSRDVEKALSLLCYSDEVIKQTQEAMDEYGIGQFTSETQAEISGKYPKARVGMNHYSETPYYFSLPFDLNLLVDKLSQELMEKYDAND
jgi:hypothetical protein